VIAPPAQSNRDVRGGGERAGSSAGGDSLGACVVLVTFMPSGSQSLTMVDLRAGRSSERLPAGIARVCDGVLDFLVLGLAAWTVVYHVCLVLRIDAVWAGLVGVAALVPCGLLAARSEPAPELPPPPSTGGSHWLRRFAVLNVAAGIAAAALFAFTDAPWRAVWFLWALAAGAAVLLTILRPTGWPAAEPTRESPREAWLTTAVALAWAGVLGVVALFLVRGSEDDTYYVHLSSWIADHGSFPLRDTIFSDEVFPAIIYPPLSSVEAAVGTIARFSGVEAPDVVYYFVAPLVSVLGVLAVWRLYRTWRVPLVAVALSVAMIFLLLDSPEHRALGNTLLTRTWHGKVALAAVLVPLLFVLLQQYVEQPTRRRVVLLAAAGASSVGLSSTAVFLVPVVAAGCTVAIARTAPRRAAVALAAVAAYPIGAGIVASAVGGRTAETNPFAQPDNLLHFVLADGVLALVAVAAILFAPVLIPQACSARMTAATVLLVTVLFAPPITRAVYEVTGLGRVLWRLTWAIPTAALIGVLAVGLAARFRSPVLRTVPVVVLCGAFIVWGTPSWSTEVHLATRPAWKRPPGTVSEARWILTLARPGDVVLAPTKTSQTIATMSGDVYTVAPRVFYAIALRDTPGGHARQRVLLGAFADDGLEGIVPRTKRPPEAAEVVEALGLVDVDLACVVDDPDTRAVLGEAGYAPVGTDRGLVCARRSL
jgi:Family of unknown function (DUF6077)